MTSVEMIQMQELFTTELFEYFGYDIVGSDSHPLKSAFELYVKMKREEEEEEEEDDEIHICGKTGGVIEGLNGCGKKEHYEDTCMIENTSFCIECYEKYEAKEEEEEEEYPTIEEILSKMKELKEDENEWDDDTIYDAICEWDDKFADDPDWFDEEDTDVKDRLRDDVAVHLGWDVK